MVLIVDNAGINVELLFAQSIIHSERGGGRISVTIHSDVTIAFHTAMAVSERVVAVFVFGHSLFECNFMRATLVGTQ